MKADLLQRLYGNNQAPIGGFNPALPDFYAPFADAGAGAVNLTLTRGSGSATFTRATTATTTLSDGTIAEVASGTARSYYAPDGAYLGYIGEASETNYCLQSEDFGTTWTAIGTPTRSAAAATLGIVDLDLIGDDSGAAAEGYSQIVTTVGNSGVNVSFYCKAGTATTTTVRIYDNTAATARMTLTVTWTGGVPSASGASASQVDGPFGASGVYRIRATQTGGYLVANSNQIEIYPAGITAGNTGNVHIGGVMVNSGTPALHGAYIPTSTVSVTRNSDVLTYPVSGNFDQTKGVIYGECSVTRSYRINVISCFMQPDGSQNRGLYVNGGSAVTTINTHDGTTAVQKTGLTSLLLVPRKRACAFGGSTASVTGDGATVASGSFDGAMGNVAVYVSSNQSTGMNDACVKELKIWRTKATDAQLEALTA